jgi:acetyl-CoA acetyltransferase
LTLVFAFAWKMATRAAWAARGEARHFIAGGAIELGGRLPVNTHGGQLGEAYIHGMNGITEAVRQVRRARSRVVRVRKPLW